MSVDSVYRKRSTYDDRTQETFEQEREDDLPEELVEQLEHYVGDGRAALTVSGSLSSNRHFHKAEAFVSIKVTCNNGLEEIEAAHGIVRPYVLRYLEADLEEVSRIRDKWLDPPYRMHDTKQAPAKEAPTELPPEERTKSPPKRTSSIRTGNKSVKKPTFRR